MSNKPLEILDDLIEFIDMCNPTCPYPQKINLFDFGNGTSSSYSYSVSVSPSSGELFYTITSGDSNI